MPDDINSILGLSEGAPSASDPSGRTPSARQKYIQRIRSESAYPVFRSLVNTFAILLYIFGALFIVAGFIIGFSLIAREGAAALAAMFGGVIAGLIYIIIGRVSKEASFMFADLADSITDLNSRYEQQE